MDPADTLINRKIQLLLAHSRLLWKGIINVVFGVMIGDLTGRNYSALNWLSGNERCNYTTHDSLRNIIHP